MKRILIIGQCPLNYDGAKDFIAQFSHEQALGAEINIIDAPRIGGENKLEDIGGVFIHRYGFICFDKEDEIQLIKMIVRDAVSLGPEKCIVAKNYSNIQKTIINILKSYGMHFA